MRFVTYKKMQQNESTRYILNELLVRGLQYRRDELNHLLWQQEGNWDHLQLGIKHK